LYAGVSGYRDGLSTCGTLLNAQTKDSHMRRHAFELLVLWSCYREYHRKLHDLRAIFIRSITPATPLPHPDIYAATSDSWQRVRIDGIS
jgi:hypothetical protein